MMDELELNFNINFQTDFSIDLDFEDTLKSRIVKPPACKGISFVKSKYALDLANEIGKIEKNTQTYAIINGSFILFDFIFELLINQESPIKKMTISTLSYSQENIETLAMLVDNNCIKELNLIVSDYFYSHEKNSLIKFAYECLDKNDIFQLSVCRTHCKTCIFELENGIKVTIHGSANLRSSNNIEQICIQEGSELYDFNDIYQDNIINTYKTINKSLTGNKLWNQVTNI
jgi:hypothetical protein